VAVSIFGVDTVIAFIWSLGSHFHRAVTEEHCRRCRRRLKERLTRWSR
jgi:hypothetical protein